MMAKTAAWPTGAFCSRLRIAKLAQPMHAPRSPRKTANMHSPVDFPGKPIIERMAPATDHIEDAVSSIFRATIPIVESFCHSPEYMPGEGLRSSKAPIKGSVSTSVNARAPR